MTAACAQRGLRLVISQSQGLSSEPRVHQHIPVRLASLFRGIRSPAWKQQIHRQAATLTQHFSRVLGIGTQACIAELKPNPHWLPVLRYRLCVDLALTWPLPVLHRHPRGDAGRAARSLEHTILSGCSIAAAARSQEKCRPYLPQWYVPAISKAATRYREPGGEGEEPAHHQCWLSNS